MAKSNHKHNYVLHRKRLHGNDFWELLNVCSICGFVKKPPTKIMLVRRTDGSFRWICRLTDIIEQYGDVPVYKE